MLTNEVKKYIDQSVLCWLATSGKDNEPNVSPKEMFTYEGDTTLLIANIASPNTIKNIRENPIVCISFVDIFVQKGFKIKGYAELIEKDHANYASRVKILTDMFTDKFPITAVIEIAVRSVDPIHAPSYLFYPATTEGSQIESAMKTYKISNYLK